MAAQSNPRDQSHASPTDLEFHLHRLLPTIYLVLSLTLTTILCLMIPPFFVPDEIAHSLRAIQISHGEVVGKRLPQGVGGMVDTNLKQIADAVEAMRAATEQKYTDGLRRPPGRVTPAQLAPFRALRWTHRSVFKDFQNTAVYPPFFYLPQAVGWLIGQSANLTILHSLLLARLLTAWSALLIGWSALRLCAAGRWCLCLYLLLPTTLGLNSSCSQDSLLLACAGLVAALLSRPVQARRLLTRGELAAVTLLLALLIAARPPYLPLALLLLLPSLAVKSTFREKWLLPLSALAAIAAFLGIWQMLVHPLGNYVYPLADPARQIHFLRSNPLAATGNILASTLILEPLLIPQALAGFGFLDVYAPRWVYFAIAIGFLGYALLTKTQRPATLRQCGLLLLLTALVCYGLAFAEYLIYSPPGNEWVVGLQGRYLTAMLPLLILLLGRGHRSPQTANSSQDHKLATHDKISRNSTRGIALAISFFIFLIAVLDTPWFVAYQFYTLDFVSALRQMTLF